MPATSTKITTQLHLPDLEQRADRATDLRTSSSEYKDTARTIASNERSTSRRYTAFTKDREKEEFLGETRRVICSLRRGAGEADNIPGNNFSLDTQISDADNTNGNQVRATAKAIVFFYARTRLMIRLIGWYSFRGGHGLDCVIRWLRAGEILQPIFLTRPRIGYIECCKEEKKDRNPAIKAVWTNQIVIPQQSHTRISLQTSTSGTTGQS